MSKSEYNIPVQFQLEKGRYKPGYVKSLKPDKKGQVRVMYTSGDLSSRSLESLIAVPQGFNKRETPEGVARGPKTPDK